jgi:hypothetical protein
MEPTKALEKNVTALLTFEVEGLLTSTLRKH